MRRSSSSASRRCCWPATATCCPCPRSRSTASSPSARPSTRSVRSPQQIPIFDPDVCIDCGRCAAVCPHATIRMKVYDPAVLDGAPEGFRTKAFRSKDVTGMAMTIQVAPDDCTGCGVCVDMCPAKSKSEVGHKAINMEPAAAHRDGRTAFVGLLPRAPRDRPGRPAARLGQGRPGAAAAVRVLGRLRRMRRDAVHQARHPAVRRPHDRGQRHRLLVDLRRQPADHTVDHEHRRTRPGVEQLVVRGQRRVRPRYPPRLRGPAAPGATARRAAGRHHRSRPGDGDPRRRSVDRGRHQDPARARGPPADRARAASATPTIATPPRSISRRSPMRS